MAEKKPKPDAARAKKKAEAAEVARRVEEVLRVRLDGAQFHDGARGPHRGTGAQVGRCSRHFSSCAASGGTRSAWTDWTRRCRGRGGETGPLPL
jgi:hypothetical protein